MIARKRLRLNLTLSVGQPILLALHSIPRSNEHGLKTRSHIEAGMLQSHSAGLPEHSISAGRYASLVIIGVGFSVLVGWFFDIHTLKSVLPWFVAMKANTAIGFVLLGSSLYLFSHRSHWRMAGPVSFVCAGLVTLLGILSFSEYVFTLDFGIDNLFFQEKAGAIGTLFPGRMALVTALNFILGGSALLCLHFQRALILEQVLALLSGLIGLVGLTCYMYRGTWHIGIGVYAQMAFHTACLFMIFCIGMLLNRPTVGMMRLVTSQSMGGWLIKRLFPIVLTILICLGWLRIWGEQKGFFENALGTALLIVILLVLLSGVIYWAAVALERMEEENKQTALQIKETRDQFELIFSTSPDGVLISGLDGTIVNSNESFALLTGYTRDELLGKSIYALHIWQHADERDKVVSILKTNGYCDNFEATFQRKDKTLITGLLSAKIIAFQGQPLILSITRDITERKQAERNALLIFKTQAQLLQLNTLEDAFRLIGETIHELIGDGYVFVCLLDEVKKGIRVIASLGMGDFVDKITPLFGFDPSQMFYPLEEMPAETLQSYRSGKLNVLPEGIYDLGNRKFPKVMCLTAEKLLGVHAVHTIGFTWYDQHFGGLVIMAKRNISSLTITIETLVGQASLTIRRLWIEKELRLRNIMLSTQQEATLDGILVVDDHGSVLSTNRRFQEMWGIPDAILATKDEAVLLPALLAQVVEPEIFLNKIRSLSKAPSLTSQDELTLNDGRVFDTYSTPMKDTKADPLGRIWFFHDITQKRALHEQLFQAQKMESIGRLASGIAHEINTPVQYIGDNVQFLQDSAQAVFALTQELLGAYQEYGTHMFPADLRMRLDDRLRSTDIDFLYSEVPQAFKQTQDGINRISTIVRAMKEFAHPGDTEKTLTDINHAIESTLIVARTEWKYVADVVTDLDPGLPLVPCLVNEFNQVILNMVVNAAHAITESLGKKALKPTGEKGKITLTTRATDTHVEIRISDTGNGIPESIRSKIFDPFFTTKPVGQGTGQGLAIARNVIVKKHNGTIDVESTVGQGTTFILRLPLA